MAKMEISICRDSIEYTSCTPAEVQIDQEFYESI